MKIRKGNLTIESSPPLVDTEPDDALVTIGKRERAWFSYHNDYIRIEGEYQAPQDMRDALRDMLAMFEAI